MEFCLAMERDITIQSECTYVVDRMSVLLINNISLQLEQTHQKTTPKVFTKSAVVRSSILPRLRETWKQRKSWIVARSRLGKPLRKLRAPVE